MNWHERVVIINHFNVWCIAHEILNKWELLKQKLEMIIYDENENEK
jgi:hypothetical protein